MGSIFDILGPVMVGPSSSHTAGAARIGMVARQLFGRQPEKAAVYLHGSFAATGKGHGTDRALIAGLLGMKPDDMRIPDSFEIAAEEGMTFTIAPKEIREAHPNTAQVIMEAEGVAPMKIQAYSVGGGRIRVCEIDGIDVNFSGESNTLIIRNIDEPGRIKEVAVALSNAGIPRQARRACHYGGGDGPDRAAGGDGRSCEQGWDHKGEVFIGKLTRKDSKKICLINQWKRHG